MLNSFQHLIKSTDYETLNQVQGDTNRFGQHAPDIGHYFRYNQIQSAPPSLFTLPQYSPGI